MFSEAQRDLQTLPVGAGPSSTTGGISYGLYSLDPDLRLNFIPVSGLGQDKSRAEQLRDR